MLRIRLSRGGKKKQPHYRVVVANIDSKRDGRVVERIGHYHPLADPIQYLIKEDRALYWLSVGAQPSDAVARLLEKQGTIARLNRLRAGESIETLVAEYEGHPLEVEAAPVAEEVQEAEVIEEAEADAVLEEETVEEASVEVSEDTVDVADEDVSTEAETAEVEDVDSADAADSSEEA